MEKTWRKVLGYPINGELHVVVHLGLRVNRNAPVVIFEEQVLERGQVLLLEHDDHLVAQAKGNQLEMGKGGIFVTQMATRSSIVQVWEYTWMVMTAILTICSRSFHGFRPRA